MFYKPDYDMKHSFEAHVLPNLWVIDVKLMIMFNQPWLISQAMICDIDV